MEIDVASLPPEIAENAGTPIAWEGGECPVPANTLVQIQCVFEEGKDFDYSQPPRKAGAWARHWNRDHGDLVGITHYVIVDEPRAAGGAL